MKGKKGQAMQQLSTLAVGVATLAIVLTVTFLIMAEGGDEAADIAGASNYDTCNSSACNGTKELQSAVDDIPGWVPLIIIAMVGAILLGLVKLFRK